MANKSVYQNFDTDALTHFELNNDSLYGVIVGSKVENVLCTQDQTTYEKIQRILTVPTEDDQTFRNKKKAFILPKCNVSSDRLKAALKECERFKLLENFLGSNTSNVYSFFEYV